MDVADSKNFWIGKKVLVTGHTGFKGSWLSIWLYHMGAEVIGYSLDPLNENDNFVLSRLSERIVDVRGDILDTDKLSKVFAQFKPEIVFHLAAQPLVRLSYRFPKQTYETNVIGTLNVLDCIRNSEHTKVGVMITTDKCYENKEQIWGYREDDPMGGYDPYSSSKACAEILISSYRSSFLNPDNYDSHGKSIASVRAGNVIGGGDWSADRLIPDCVRALESDKPIKIRNPQSIRPWQHVLEPLSGYLLLAERMYDNPLKYSGGWNFGPEPDAVKTVWEICELVIDRYGKGALIDESDKTQPHESKLLSLDITKAKTILGWKPKFDVYKTVDITIDWYRKYKSNDVYKLCVDTIRLYK